MNITELCYLDRVSFNGKTIVVTGIDGTFNEVTDEFHNLYDASVLSPIEVTDEILLLNGFKRSGKVFVFQDCVVYDSGRIEFLLSKESFFVKSAHELQHVMNKLYPDFSRYFCTM